MRLMWFGAYFAFEILCCEEISLEEKIVSDDILSSSSKMVPGELMKVGVWVQLVFWKACSKFGAIKNGEFFQTFCFVTSQFLHFLLVLCVFESFCRFQWDKGRMLNSAEKGENKKSHRFVSRQSLKSST